MYATISMPPRGGKTETLAHGLAWRTLMDPACLNFYATFGDDLTQQTSRRVRSIVRAEGCAMDDERQSINDWRTILQGGLRATSVGGAVTGSGCNSGLMVADDLVKGREFAESKLNRDRAWDWLRDDYMSRLEPGASMIVNMTRWNEDDVIGRLMHDPLGLKWRHIEIPAISGPDGQPADERNDADVVSYWPAVYNLEALKAIRMRGEYGWWSLYQQRPSPRGGGMFKGQWFADALVNIMPTRARWVRSWDLAASTESDSAYTAGALVGLADNALYVADMQRGQWGADVRDRKILETAQLDGKHVEIRLPQDPGQAGKSQKPHFAKLLHGYKVSFEIESGAKDVRADPYASQCAAGNVHLLRGAPWVRDFVGEHESFPAAKLKDQVDAMSGAYGLLIGSGSAVDQARKLAGLGGLLSGMRR
ncbi:MAG: phage terminase large subunit [Actinobacteria bacterium]|nr:phage terminase large subunit [Actinomycetota bacterium]